MDRRGIELRLDGEVLAFYENNTRCGTVPVKPLSRVFLRGDLCLSASVLGKLGEHGVGVVVVSGRKGGGYVTGAPAAQRRTSQARPVPFGE